LSAKLEKLSKHPGVYRRAGRYVTVVPYREGGRTKQRWITTGSVAAALDARRAFKNSLDAGVKPANGKMTLATFVRDEWLPYLQGKSRLYGKPTRGTVQRYGSQLALHVIGTETKPGPLADLPLKDIDGQTLERLYAGLASGAKAQYIHSILSSAFSYATKSRRFISSNPCASIERPRAKRQEASVLTAAEARGMLNAARGERVESAVLLGIGAGLRISEVCAIRWGDIDFTTGRVVVSTSYWGRTKSGKVRSVTLPAGLLEQLRAYRVRQAEGLLRCGVRQDETTHAVTTWRGTMISPDALRDAFARFCRAKGIEYVGFHALRHTSATLMLLGGVDIRTAAGRLGHASPQLLLNVYGHYVGSGDTEAASKLGAALTLG
jgi:integrase